MSDVIQNSIAGLPGVLGRPEPVQAGRPTGGLERSRQSAPVQTEEPKKSSRPEGLDSDQLRREIQEAIDRLNEQMHKEGRNLAFSIDKKVNQTVITVKNSHTGEVVRQIPDEVLLHVAHSIEDIKGLLYDKVS